MSVPISLLSLRRLRAPALCAALAALAACDGRSPVSPGPPPAAALQAVRCVASVRALRVSCGSEGAPEGVAATIIGGQHVNVRVATTNPAYDSVAQVFAIDVTVQNLLVQRMGADGFGAVPGIRVFFHSGPNSTVGKGVMTVKNPDGEDSFTSSGQPYFLYPQSLGYQEVSSAKRWEFDLPKTVQEFDFLLLISAPLVPTVVFDMVAGGNTDLYRMGIDGGDLVRLTSATLADEMPTVAKRSVVFTSYRDGNAELYSMPAAGGAQTRLTATAAISETRPALSPGGTRLAWVESSSGTPTKVWTGAANASGRTQLNPGAAYAFALENAPSWDTASVLVFTSTQNGSSDVWKTTVGGTPQVLASSPQSDFDAVWSPDATKVVYSSNRTGDTELYLLDPSTGAGTRLTTRTGSDGAPTWLDNQRIVFTCFQGTTPKLCLIDTASPGAGTLLTTPGASHHAAAVRF